MVLPGSLTRSYVQPYKQLLFLLNPGTEIKLAAELQVNGMFPKTCAFHERVWMLKYTARSLKDALRDEKEKKEMNSNNKEQYPGARGRRECGFWYKETGLINACCCLLFWFLFRFMF